MTILQIVLPIFAIIFAGYFLRRFNVVKANWVHILNSFVYYVSLPSVILASFWEINWYSGEVWKLLGQNLLGLVVFSALLLSTLHFTKLSQKLKAAIYVTALVGNTIYMGFPIAGGAFKPELFSGVIAAATAHLAFGIIFGVLVTEFLVIKSRRFFVYFKDLAKNPLMTALLLGMLLSLLKFNQPAFDVIKKPFLMLGTTASPVALFALGGFLRGKFSKKHLKLSLITSGLKLLLLPMFMFFLLSRLGALKENISIALLLSAMPSAVTCFVISEQYELEESFVANSIVISTIASLFTISMVLIFLH